jgi:hypothetical protein
VANKRFVLSLVVPNKNSNKKEGLGEDNFFGFFFSLSDSVYFACDIRDAVIQCVWRTEREKERERRDVWVWDKF